MRRGSPATTLALIIAVFTAGLFVGFSINATLTKTATTTIQTQTGTFTGVSTVCFSRVEQCDNILIQLIRQARENVYVAVYSFTRDGLARALVEARGRGVDVKVVIERDNALGEGSEYRFLKENGVNVRLDSNPSLMHHKFMVLDGEIVVTGSYNWSTAAEDRNDENLVVIKDSGAAARFTAEFNRLWELAE